MKGVAHLHPQAKSGKNTVLLKEFCKATNLENNFVRSQILKKTVN